MTFTLAKQAESLVKLQSSICICVAQVHGGGTSCPGLNSFTDLPSQNLPFCLVMTGWDSGQLSLFPNV